MTQNIAVMRKNFDGTEWKRAFAETLIGLQPDMNPDRADELSDAEYLRSRSTEPANAARRWVASQADPGRPSVDSASGLARPDAESNAA